MRRPDKNFSIGQEENLPKRRKEAYEGSIWPSIPAFFERGIEKYEKLLGVSMAELKGKLVLDIGSGPNEIFSKEAKKKGVKVISLSPELKHEDIREMSRGSFLDTFYAGGKQRKSVAGIVQELPFQNEAFDAEVSLYGGIHYLPLLESEYRLALSEIIRTLRPGGAAYLFPVNIEADDKDAFMKFLEGFSSQADIQIDFIEKSSSARPNLNLYKIVLVKKQKNNDGKN